MYILHVIMEMWLGVFFCKLSKLQIWYIIMQNIHLTTLSWWHSNIYKYSNIYK